MPTLARIIVARLLPTVVLANGGPVAYSDGTATGNVLPLVDSQVSLVEEDLTLTILPDGRHCRAEAHYVLANPGDTVEVTYGVPMGWRVPVSLERARMYPLSDAERAVTEEARIAASKVSLVLAGEKVPCRAAPWAQGGPPGRPPSLVTGPMAQGWCLASLRIPHGEAIPLDLGYEQDLRFGLSGGDAAPNAGYRVSTLDYPLFPAGYWRGPVRRLTIRLDPGLFDGLVESVAPAGAKLAGTSLVWQLENANLKDLVAVRARINLEPVLAHREVVAAPLELLGTAPPLRARASSVRSPGPGSTHVPENATDRDAATAWCEGKPGAGLGEWLEVSWDMKPTLDAIRGNESAYHCKLEGVLVVPGHAKDTRAYLDNNRLRRFRLSRCDGSHEIAYSLEPGEVSRGIASVSEPPGLSSRFDRSALHAYFESDLSLDCIRLTIDDVVAGKTGDTCISELRPAYFCICKAGGRGPCAPRGKPAGKG